MPNRPIHIASVVRAAHFILTGYGHWLPNDPRGSGSVEVRKRELEDLGPIHHGRKRVQPSRQELRLFHQEAEPLLDHDVLWFSEPDRIALAQGFSQAVRHRGYTVWACAVLRNHAHLVVRTHRDDALTMWEMFAEGARESLVVSRPELRSHPVWSERPYKVFLKTNAEIRSRIVYVENNPVKENLPRQQWAFVKRFR